MDPSVARARQSLITATVVEGVSSGILGCIAAVLNQRASKWVWAVPAILFLIAIGLPSNAGIRGEFFAQGCAEAGDTRCTPFLMFTLEALRGACYSAAAWAVFWFRAEDSNGSTATYE